MGKNRQDIMIALIAIICISTFYAVLADPNGPTAIGVGQSSRGVIDPAKTVSAQAGNVTELNINATSITKAWQGYYGNISGTLTLDNANNWTMYDWRMITPSGKIYSTRNNTAINWGSVICANDANITAEDAYMQNTNAADAINETFTKTSSSFYVGDNLINGCPATFTYVNDTNQSSQFQEAILLDPTKNALIFTALIENKKIGFDNRSHDFQMIVPEYGRNGDVATTPYYFYVELN